MDKSRVCVTQASKLAKQKCVKKTNLLVYEKKPDPCSKSAKNAGYVMPPIAAVPAKKIRICTGADLKRMCPPRLCSCPPRKARRGFFGGIAALLGLGIKAGVAAALVYWTYDIGLWGDSEDTEELYLDIRDMIVPQKLTAARKHRVSPLCQAEIELMCKPPNIRDDDGACLKAPSTEKAIYTLKEYWNKAVVTAFDILTDFPAYLAAAYKSIKNIGQETKCVKTEDANEK